MTTINRTRYAILGMLGIEPKSGYDIKKDIDEGLGFFWNESYGQIYKELQKLTKDKLITKKDVTQKNKPTKHVYSLTKKGKQELKDYLTRPPEKLLVRDEMALKILSGFQVPKEVTIKNIKTEILKMQNMYDSVQNKRKDIPIKFKKHKTKCIYLSLIGELGAEMIKTKINWYNKIIKELNQKL